MPEMKARFGLRTFAATVLVSLCAAAPATADVVTISGTADTRNCFIATDGISEGGSCNTAQMGISSGWEFRGLLWFDVAAYVPSNATVNSAYLRLPKNGFTAACGLGLIVREQTANWLTTTPNWSSPDGGTTQWAGGSATWSGLEHEEYACDDDWAVFDVTTPARYWVDGQYVNHGVEIVNEFGTFFAVGSTFTPGVPELVIDFD
jgi:hypothetical protein